ncbi:MAG TPA: MFS transporter [Streptosporangiaceae bacterium]|nr:MFS transporter [Streptosporangiaceae bacterium]
MAQTQTLRNAAKAGTAGGVNPWGVLAIILTAVFMQLLDTTITMVGVPSIQNSLHSSFGEIQLVVAGYMLAFACVLVLGGRLGDTFGRKRMFWWGMAGFTVASAVCGAAPDALTLIVSRVVQGMASGLMFPQVLGIIQVVFRKDQRTKAIGFYGATIGLATILGPVTGGGLIDLNIAGWGWRSIFFVNVPIGVAALALGAMMIPESRAVFTGGTVPPGPPSATSRLDLPGALLLGAGLFLLVLPLVIGRDEDWPAWSFACIAVSPFVLAAFSAYERNRTRRDRTPLIDTTLFRQRPFTLGLVACLVFFTGIPSFFMILLLTLQEGLGYSPVKAGAVTLGFAAALAIGSARSAAATKKLGTRVLVAGCALMVLGQLAVMGVMVWVGTGLRGWQLLIPMFIAGLGGGLFIAPVTNVVLAGITSRNAGSASGALATAQQVGAALGIAVVGVIFFGLLGANANTSSAGALPQLRHELTLAGVPASQQPVITGKFQACFSARLHAKDPAATPAICTQTMRSIEASPAPAPVKAAVSAAIENRAVPAAKLDDFTRSMRTALWWQVGVFALALVLAARLPRIRLDADGPMVGGA